MLESELQELYNELFAYRREMACKFDADTRLIVVNEAYAKAMNMHADQLIGEKFIDLIPEEEHQEVLSHLRALTEKSPERTYEHKVILQDGTEKWQQWYDRAIFDSEGRLKYFISLGRDITQRKLLELEIEHRNRFQAILADLAIRLINLPVKEFDSAMDDVLSIVGIYTQMEFALVNFRDPEGKVIKRYQWTEHKNEKQQLFEKGALLSEIEEVTSELGAQTVYVEDIAALAASNPFRNRLQKHGLKSLIAAPLIKEGKIAGSICFFTISESRFVSDTELRLLKLLAELILNVETRRTYENRLIDAWNEAESANDAKTQFLANISHEIRTPLNGVLGMADLILGTNLDDRQQKYANVLTSSGESLKYIINDLLDMNKLAGEKLTLDRSVFRLGDVISEVTELNKPKAEKKGLAFDVEIHQADPGIILRGAKLRFKQILMNLVGNAVKFTEKGGVRIECTASESRTNAGAVKVLCRVTDTGIGIENKNLEKLFKPFSQVDQSTRRKYGGTGLGLHISKTIAEQLGGEIGTESIPGIRTTFWFYVFFEKVSLQEARKLPGFIAAESENKTDVLLAGFEPDTVRLFQRDIELLQLNSQAFEGIDEAKAFLDGARQQANPGFIFMDFSRTGTDALVFTDELKNDFNHMNRKVVLIASPGDEVDMAWIEAHDIHQILIRPVSISKLMEAVVRDGLSRSTAPAESPRVSGKADKQKPAPQRKTATDKTQGKIRVLIAEDNPVNQELISVIMHELNVPFDIVNNGFEAVEAVKLNQYDIILMDCQMPEMDGFDATRAIRAMDDPKKSTVPIIAVTAHVISGYKTKCENAGMNGYISKPYSVKDLQSAIFGQKPESAVLQGDDFRALKIIDYERYINRFGNDTELCSRILIRFVEETEKQAAMLAGLWGRRDYNQLYDQVHSIKGASANIDAERMFSAAQKLSAAIERRQDAVIPKRIERLQNEFQRLRKKLEETQYRVSETQQGGQN